MSIRTIYKTLVLLLGLITVWGCQEDFDNSNPADGLELSSVIGFSSYVINSPSNTRAVDDVIVGPDGERYEVMEQKWNDSYYVGHGIKIHQYKKRVAEAGYRTASDYYYEIPIGKQGVLEIMHPQPEGNETDAGIAPLVWDGGDTKHIFHGWVDQKPERGLTMIDNTYGLVNYDTDNSYLENLVAFCTPAVDYATNGQTVQLLFKRMLSRMVILHVTHIDKTGKVNKNGIFNVVNIEFPNMQSTAKFVTGVGSVPFADGTGIEIPHVEPWPVGDLNAKKGLNISQIHNVYDWGNHLIYHMSPFVMAMENADGTYTSTGMGKFRMIYDLGNGEYSFYEGDLATFASRITELKAGEIMEVEIIVSDNAIKGMSIWIEPWNTETGSSVGVQAHPGVYSHDEFVELRDLLNEKVKNKDLSIEETDEILKGYFTTDENGDRVIRIYNNIYNPDFNFDSLWLPEGYVLDGMGHVLTYQEVRPSGSNKGVFRDLTLVSGGVSTVYSPDETESA